MAKIMSKLNIRKKEVMNNAEINDENEIINKENNTSSSKGNREVSFFKKGIFKQSLMKSVVMLALVPVVILGVFIMFTVDNTLDTRIDEDVANNIRGTALNVLIAYNQNPGDYYVGEDGNLWKGSFNVGRSVELLKSIGEASKVDIAVYTKDKCAVSTKEGEHAIPQDIKKIVIDKESDFFSSNYYMEGVSSYVYGITIIDERTEEIVGMIVVWADRQSRTITKTTVVKYTGIAITVTIIIVSIVAIILSRRIVIAMQDGIKGIRQLSDGELMISSNKKYLKRGDEVGSMHKSLVILVNNLRSMINNIIAQTKKLLQTSKQIDDTANKTKDSIEQVNNAMGIMSETAIAQSKTSDKVVDNIAVLKNMIEHTYNEIQQLNQTKRTMQLEERRVENVVNNLTYINASLNEIIEVINSQVETTYNSANKIKKSAELISEFADETNLLALNAAIEAARVGEQGKGFAIVANQIKQLADQSNVVSMNISNDIGELVKDSNKSLVTMEEVNTIIGKLNDNIVITEDVFTQINTGIDDVSQRVDQIKHSVEKMDDASTSIWEVTDELKEIAKKNSKCASDTNSVTDYMTELFTEASKLKKVSDELADSMKVFKL